MSKAFVPEDTSADVPVRPVPRGELRAITRSGRRDLLTRFEGLGSSEGAEAQRAALAATLAAVVPTPSGRLRGGAGFGCIVTVEDDEGRARTLRIVGPDETSRTPGDNFARVSAAAPLAQALLGQPEGTTVEVTLAGRETSLTVRAIAVPEDD